MLRLAPSLLPPVAFQHAGGIDACAAALAAASTAATREFEVIKSHNLSLWDRASLATGLSLNRKVLTADRSWATLYLAIEIRLIR